MADIVIFDTDVLIWTLRGNVRAADAIDGAPVRQFALISHFELLEGLRDKRELAALTRLLRRFEAVPLTEDIGILGLRLMEQLALRVHISPADALIAATALTLGVPLHTGNVKHFRHIPDLKVVPFRP